MPDIEQRLRDEFGLLRQILEVSGPDPTRVFALRRRWRFLLRHLPATLLTTIGVIGASTGLALALTSTLSRSAPSTTTAPTAPHTTAAPTTTTTTVPLTPVPAGFDPDVFTAVSDQEFWVLGSAPCAAGRCPTIVRTTDSGQQFFALPPPPLPPVPPPGGPYTDCCSLAFATSRDGYLYGGTTFVSTHDGGASWQSDSLGKIGAFATSGGYVYLTTEQCLPGLCRVTLIRSPVWEDKWTQLAMPIQEIPASEQGDPYAPGVVMAAHGSSLWVIAMNGPTQQTATTTSAISSNDGGTFRSAAAPCNFASPVKVEPTSSSVVWAVCATGMRALAFRSVDGGFTFEQLTNAPELVNSAQLAPRSDTAAFLDTAGAGSPNLYETTDGGGTWTAATFQPANFVPWMGFTDPSTGEALVQNPAPDGTITIQLWRTTDGGSTWSQVSF